MNERGAPPTNSPPTSAWCPANRLSPQPEPADDVQSVTDAPDPQAAQVPAPAAATPAQPKPPAAAPAQKQMTRQERLRALVRRMA